LWDLDLSSLATGRFYADLTVGSVRKSPFCTLFRHNGIVWCVRRANVVEVGWQKVVYMYSFI